jgi:hypothetical protein
MFGFSLLLRHFCWRRAAELKNDANFETMFNVPAKKTSNSKKLVHNHCIVVVCAVL